MSNNYKMMPFSYFFKTTGSNKRLKCGNCRGTNYVLKDGEMFLCKNCRDRKAMKKN